MAKMLGLNDIENAEHIGADTTGDNITAKKVASYQWDGENWQRASTTQSISGSVTVSTSTPTAVVAFKTTVTTAGTRVQLGSNVISGVILEAPSTNSGLIYVGGSNVSSTVFGAELQPGQSTSIAIDNTNKIYVDSSVNGDKVAALGS